MKFKNLTSVVLVALMVVGCSSSNDDSNDPNSEIIITYDAYIRDIVTLNCIACHDDPPSSGAPMPLTTYEFVKNAVQTRGLLDRINSTTNPMPPYGEPLTEQEKNLFQKWVDNGLLEN